MEKMNLALLTLFVSSPLAHSKMFTIVMFTILIHLNQTRNQTNERTNKRRDENIIFRFVNLFVAIVEQGKKIGRPWRIEDLEHFGFSGRKTNFISKRN